MNSEMNLAGNKIRFCEIQSIQKTLIYCSALVGLKPESIEIQIASKFIQSQFPHLTIKNLKNAFELNSTNKHWEIIKPYGSFNTIFIGEILSQFDNYNRKTIITEKKALKKPLKQHISYEEAKPMMDKLSKELNQKFNINKNK